MNYYMTRLPEDELMHYGVKGMKWGVRRARKLQSKANIARDSAKEWDEMAGYARAKGKVKKADKYSANAAEDRADAAKYQAKANRKVEKRYAKAGRVAGEAAFERDKGDQEYKRHNESAKVFDKAAAKYEKQGSYFKAEASRKSAEALRARGENIRAAQYELADGYLKRSNKLNKKADEFAKSTDINLGKKKVDSILSEWKKKGYDDAKEWDEINREMETEELLGSTGYDVYNKLRGK